MGIPPGALGQRIGSTVECRRETQLADESLIGRELDEVRFPVERGKVREFAEALLDPDPVYTDETAARAAGFDGIPAPLTYAVAAMHWRDQTGAYEDLGLDLPRILHGEVSFEYHAPMLVGDELTARRRVADVRKREGKRGGRMTLVTIETEITNQRGELALREIDTLIETEQRSDGATQQRTDGA